MGDLLLTLTGFADDTYILADETCADTYSCFDSVLNGNYTLTYDGLSLGVHIFSIDLGTSGDPNNPGILIKEKTTDCVGGCTEREYAYHLSAGVICVPEGVKIVQVGYSAQTCGGYDCDDPVVECDVFNNFFATADRIIQHGEPGVCTAGPMTSELDSLTCGAVINEGEPMTITASGSIV